jgi:opacity protein-like surface antigen
MCKSISIVIRPLLAALLLAVTPAALAQQSAEEEFPFTYLGVQLGVHDVDQWPARISLGNGVDFEGGVSLEEDLAWGLQLGREYENSRYELEYQRGDYAVDMINLNSLTEDVLGGEGKYEALMLNALRLHDFSERLTAYAGLGIGLGRAILPAQGFAGGCQCFPKAEDSGFLWQARLGVEYRIGERSRLGLHYSRLFDMSGPLEEDGIPSIAYSKRDIDTLALSLRWEF